jgi:hypothetical protein
MNSKSKVLRGPTTVREVKNQITGVITQSSAKVMEVNLKVMATTKMRKRTAQLFISSVMITPKIMIVKNHISGAGTTNAKEICHATGASMKQRTNRIPTTIRVITFAKITSAPGNVVMKIALATLKTGTVLNMISSSLVPMVPTIAKVP